MTKKGMNRASADVGLIFTAYNLRRIFNLIDKKVLKEFLKELGFLFSNLENHFKSIYRTFSSLDYSFLFSKGQFSVAYITYI